MILDHLTACNMIEIDMPRWKGRTVGVASYKIGLHNRIRVTASDKNGKRYFPKDFYISGVDAKKYPTQILPAGTVLYLIPINDMETIDGD